MKRARGRGQNLAPERALFPLTVSESTSGLLCSGITCPVRQQTRQQVALLHQDRPTPARPVSPTGFQGQVGLFPGRNRNESRLQF